MDADVNERFERLENNLGRLVEVVSSLAEVARSHEDRLGASEERLAALDARMDRNAELQAKNDEHLAIVIKMMDEWIRNNPRN